MSIVNPTKTLLCKEPDVTVVVGSGTNAREFKCYGDILAAASPVLDAMLSCGMKESVTNRIEFPDKDPEEWELFLQCIDNASALLFQLQDDHDYLPREELYLAPYTDDDCELRHDETINFCNVYALVPWFHEFHMEQYLHRCDLIASYGQLSHTSFTESMSEEEMTELLGLLSISMKYNLVYTKKKIIENIVRVVARFMWGGGCSEHLKLLTIQQMVELLHPFKLDEEEEGSASNKLAPCDPCFQSLWEHIGSCLDPSQILSVHIANDPNAFSGILHASLHRRHKLMKSELEMLTSDWIGNTGPFYVRCDKFQCISRNRLEFILEGRTPKEKDFVTRVKLEMMLSFIVSEGEGSYYHSQDHENTLIVSGKPVDVKKEDLNHDSIIFSTQPLQIRSSETDLTVKVGSGESMQEFKCHSAILASASAKLDSLINKASDLLLLPQLNPEGWELFYQFIDPRNNGNCLNYAKYGPIERMSDRYDYRRRDIKLLMPYFQVFDMTNPMTCCEKIIIGLIDRTCYMSVDDELEMMIELLRHGITLNIPRDE